MNFYIPIRKIKVFFKELFENTDKDTDGYLIWKIIYTFFYLKIALKSNLTTNNVKFIN